MKAFERNHLDMWIFYKSKDRRSEENEVSLWVNGISGLMLLPSYKKLDELEYGSGCTNN